MLAYRNIKVYYIYTIFIYVIFTLGASPMSKNLFLSLISASILLFSTNASANLNNLFGSSDLFGDTDFTNLFNPSANNWVSATKIGAQSRGYTYAICHYQTDSYTNFPNHRFSVTIQGSEYSCPYSVKYNPITGEWKQ